jgi:hypothetical protein
MKGTMVAIHENDNYSILKPDLLLAKLASDAGLTDAQGKQSLFDLGKQIEQLREDSNWRRPHLAC